MNKKVMYVIIAVVAALVVALAIFFFVRGDNKEVTLDLQQLNTTISEKAPFNEMATMDIDLETLTSFYEINAEDVEEVIGKMPMMNVHASMYLVIKAKEGSVDTVKEKVEQYAAAQEQVWATYLPEQYALVQQRKLGVSGNYVYLFISENASELEALVK